MRTDIKPGFIALHSNRLEGLAQTLSAWLDRYPLNPLELERVITLSSATAEWYKIWMAREHGVFAASTVDMPGRTIWGLYRSLFSADSVLMSSATDQKTLVWRLMRLLPGAFEKPEFTALKDYVHQGGAKAHYELAKKIADLYDLYQIYRADWLESWALGKRSVFTAQGQSKALEQGQEWQAELWKNVLDELNIEQRQSVRSVMHSEAMNVLRGLHTAPAQWPRRLIVFGVNALPLQVLEFLAQMSKFTQVILCVNSPCQYHWADIMQGRELFFAHQRRFKSRGGVDLSATPMDQMHLHANALLAQWGRQSRDFVRQLDQFDDVQKTKEEFDHLKVELFDHEGGEPANMLRRIQNQIRDLEPVQPWSLASRVDDSALKKADGSIVFHIAHSLTRELEVLHDQLLSLMQSQARTSPIDPKDIVVLCPHVGESKAAIQAIFGQYDKSDSRFIPFDVADTQALQTHPMMMQLQWLLHLASSRCTLSEVMDFVASPFVAARFGLEQSDIEQLNEWLIESGVRWGLDGFQRDALGFKANGSIHTFSFGVRRMLLGLATGEMDVAQPLVQIESIEPMTSVGGLESQVLGRFDALLQMLKDWWTLSTQPTIASEWTKRYQILIEQFFKATTKEEASVMEALSRGLVTWSEALLGADFDDVLEAAVAHAAWIDHIQIAPPKQRLLASGVTFCSIKSMRNLPFKVICMIGLNEGDFPTSQRVQDFDLTKEANLQRVGDQSRAEDDRAMMLESILAAREVLYISWSGLSPRDNASKPPSVLVTQLRQYMAAQWGAEILDQVTTQHPLQPFNRAYFEAGGQLHTHASEWRDIHVNHVDTSNVHAHSDEIQKENSTLRAPLEAQESMPGVSKGSKQPNSTKEVNIRELWNFYKNPVKDYFVRELAVNFKAQEVQSKDFDHEAFRLKGLDLFQVKDKILKAFVQKPERLVSIKDNCWREIQKLKHAGVWMVGAMGDLFESQLHGELVLMLNQYKMLSQSMNDELEPLSYAIEMPEVVDGCVLAGQLKCRAARQGTRERYLINIQANALKGSKEIRHDLLFGSWLEFLVLKALGLEVKVSCLFSDAWIEFDTLGNVENADSTFAHDQLKAKSHLIELVGRCIGGQTKLLPMPLKTALKYAQEINPDKALESAREVYEGGYKASFFESQEMSLGRAYPQFCDLIKNPSTLEVWVSVLGPFLEWVKTLQVREYEVVDDGVTP